MPRFTALRQIKQAMSPEAIRQGLAAGRAAMSGAPATDEQLAAMTSEQRALHDEAVRRAAQGLAEAAAVHREAVERELARRALLGPAGDHVYGPLPADPHTVTVEATMAATKEQLKDVLRTPFGSRRPPPPPGAPAGPVDRERQAAAERAARDAAREPYLAPDRPALTFTRLATRSRTQIEEVTAYLGSSGLSAHPELVLGVYRVPDHIDGGGLLGGTRVVEWDVVHTAAPGLPPAAPAAAPFFEAAERWVRCREGERAPLDEDLALAFLGRAGIGPEACLGIARSIAIRDHGGGDGQAGCTVTQVTGVHVLHPAGLAPGVLERMRDERPLPVGPPEGVRTEVLNWGAIARAVRPETHRRPVVPSPFPHLPSTPQELLRAYLEVVGVRPADAYGVQVTEDEPRDIRGVSQKGPLTISTNRGDEQPCADGVPRRRLTGGACVVVVHRDRPEHAEGRARWSAYERDVLQSALSRGMRLRPVVEGPGLLERGAVGRLWRGAEQVADLVEGTGGHDPFEKIPPHRYCWPPAG